MHTVGNNPLADNRAPNNNLYMLWFGLFALLPLTPGLSGPFLFDDFANFAGSFAFQVTDWNWTDFLRATLTNISGPTGRPVAMASFALNVIVFGMNPFWMKLTNILIHGANTVLLGRFVYEILRWIPDNRFPHAARVKFALAVALIWACHPLVVTSTLYVIQRMNALAMFFTLLALLTYLFARRKMQSGSLRLNKPTLWLFAASIIAGIFGVFSKENAALLPLYILLLEIGLLRGNAISGAPIISLNWLSRYILIIFLVFVFSVITFYWNAIELSYAKRPFALDERILTEVRVIWHYITMSFVPTASNFGLFLDDIELSRSLFQPITTLLSLFGILALSTAAILLNKKFPLISIGLSLFLIGHLLESSILPLEIAFEHRNYFPLSGLVLATAETCRFFLDRMERKKLIGPILAVAVILLLSALTTVRAFNWSDYRTFAQYAAEHHEKSSRANLFLANVYADHAISLKIAGLPKNAESYMDTADTHFQLAAELDPGGIASLFLWRIKTKMFNRSWPIARTDELLKRLRAPLYNPSAPGLFDLAWHCTLDPNCAFPPAELSRLFSAALENPLLEGPTRSETLVHAARFANAISDKELALYYLSGAVENAVDNVRYRLLFVSYLIELKRWENAEIELVESRQLDRFGLYQPVINAYADDIADGKSAH